MRLFSCISLFIFLFLCIHITHRFEYVWCIFIVDDITLLMLKLSHLWLGGPFRFPPEFFRHGSGSDPPCFLAQKNISEPSHVFPAPILEPATLTRKPGSFNRKMVVRAHERGGGVHIASEQAIIFRPLLWTEPDNIFLDYLTLIMKAKKTELSFYCTFIFKGSVTRTGKDRKKLLRNTWSSIWKGLMCISCIQIHLVTGLRWIMSQKDLLYSSTEILPVNWEIRDDRKTKK